MIYLFVLYKGAWMLGEVASRAYLRLSNICDGEYFYLRYRFLFILFSSIGLSSHASFIFQIQYQAAAKIQACYRGYIKRMNYLVKRECVIICQSVARRWLTLRHLEVMDAAAYVIQCVYRDYMETNRLR